jgi:hypothetical protein
MIIPLCSRGDQRLKWVVASRRETRRKKKACKSKMFVHWINMEKFRDLE